MNKKNIAAEHQFCPFTGQVLDHKTLVLVTIKAPGGTIRNFATNQKNFDTIKNKVENLGGTISKKEIK